MFYVPGNAREGRHERKRSYNYKDSELNHLETPIASTSTKAMKMSFDPRAQFQNSPIANQSSLPSKITDKKTVSNLQGKSLN